MAGSGAESGKPEIANNNPQLEEQQAPQQAILPGDRARTYRRDCVWVLGVFGGILLSAVRPELDHPHDYWAAAAGAGCLFAAICLYLYDVLDGRGRTLAAVFGALTLISIAIADSWTHDFRAAQTIVADKQLPQSTASPLPEAQLVPPAFHEKIEDLSLTVGTLQLRTRGPSPIVVTGMIPPRLYVANGVLYLDVVLWSGSLNEPAIIVRGNEFAVKPPGWDRNSNTNALEVVNENNEPVLQLIRLTPSNFRLNGIFPLRGGGWPEGSVWLADDHRFGVRTPEQPFPADFKLTPIFKYPSWKYPGEYANP
jgi:hypothetical protein